MTESSLQRPPRAAFWRNRAVRSVLYQGIVIVLVVGAVAAIFRNTFINLQERGISSGFGFLQHMAGFGISEVMPIPRLQGGSAYFLVALLIGVAVIFALSRYEAAQGRVYGDNVWLVLLAIALVVVLPGAILYWNAGSVVTVTYDESKSYALSLLTGLATPSRSRCWGACWRPCWVWCWACRACPPTGW